MSSIVRTEDVEMDLRNAPTDDRELVGWVRRTARLTRPARVVWCDGTREELVRLVEPLLAVGAVTHVTPTTLVASGLPTLPASLRERTHTAVRRPRAAARSATLWEPDALHEQVALSFEDCMRGRVMYVVPFAAGIRADGETAVGVQVTDSAYVAAVLLTSYAPVPFRTFGSDTLLLRAVHSVGQPLGGRTAARPADAPWPHHPRPWLARFPQQAETWAFGTAYEPRLASVVGGPLVLARASEDSEDLAASVA